MTTIHDTENPEWNEEDFSKARPVAEVLPQLVSPTRNVPVSIHLSPEVVAYFQAHGKGWQTRLNDVLQAYVATQKGDSPMRV